MARIINNLPYLDRHETVRIHGEPVRLRPFQIIVWVSINLRGFRRLASHVPRFPAVLDTGNNYSFTITRRHLMEWAGIRPDALPLLGPIVLNDMHMERRAANVWIHRNRKYQRVVAGPETAHTLEIDRGIAVYPDDAAIPGPRLPQGDCTISHVPISTFSR